MIFFILTLAFSGILLLLLRRSKSSFWFLGMLVGMGMLIIGFIFYLSKIGGIQKELELLFFLTPKIHKMILYTPIVPISSVFLQMPDGPWLCFVLPAFASLKAP